MKNRLEHIDIIKGLAIIFVIVGHQASLFQNKDISNWVNSFHLPLFMFAGGFMAFRTVKPELLKFGKWLNYIYKKFKSLIIPYAFWSIILYPVLRGTYNIDVIDGLYKFFVKPPDTVLWFLHTYFILLMVFSLYYIICSKIKMLNNLFVTIIVIVFLYAMCMFLEKYTSAIPHNLIAFSPYFFLGVIIANFHKIETCTKNKYIQSILFVFFVFSSINCNKSDSELLNVLIKLLAGGSASLFLYNFVQSFEFSKPVKKILLKFGQNSLII